MDWGDRRRAFSEPAPGRLPSSALQGCLPASVTTTPRALKRKPGHRNASVPGLRLPAAVCHQMGSLPRPLACVHAIRTGFFLYLRDAAR